MAESLLTEEQIATLRREASDTWQRQFPGNPPEGWSVSPLDLAAVVAVFEPLHVKPGYTLRAYQRITERAGYSLIYALPVEAPFPDPDPDAEEYPTPPDALPDIMQAIAGDGSPRSYLLASLL